MKAEIAEFLSTELKLTLSEEKTLITHSSEKVRFIGYDICVRRNQEVKGHRMKNGTWRKSRTLHMKVALSIPHTEKIEKFMFAKKVIRQKENGEFQPIHRAGLLNLADYEIVEQYNAEARGLCNYYNLACDYHTLDYFCYLMEYSCLKTIANKHKTSIRKIIPSIKTGKHGLFLMKPKQGQSVCAPLKSLTVSVAKRVTSSIRERNLAGKPLSDSGSMPEFVNYVGVKKPICMRFTLYGT